MLRSAQRSVHRAVDPLPVAGVTVFLVLAAYLPSLSGPFFTDDYRYIVENPVLRGTSLWQPWQFFTTRTNPFEYLPLRDLSFRIDLALFGLSPIGFRLHNLLLYLLCCAACWAAARAVARCVADGPECVRRDYSGWVATATVALFASHPAHVESVAWVSGRKDLLSGLYSLLSLWCFARALEGPRRARWIAAASACYAAALLSKSTSLPIVVVAVAVALAASPRSLTVGRRVAWAATPVLPMLALAAAGLIMHIRAGAYTGILQDEAAGAAEFGLVSEPILILGTLSRIALLPARLRLVYDLADPGLAQASAYILGVAMLAAAAVALSMLLIGKGGGVTLGVFSFVALCVPFLQLVPFRTWSLASERFLFLPLFGLAFAAAYVFGRNRRGTLVIASLVLLSCLGTFGRALEWRTSDGLIISNAARSPRHHLSVELLVDRLIAQRRLDDAVRAADRVRHPGARRVLEDYASAQRAFLLGQHALAKSHLAELPAQLPWASLVLRLKIANLALELGEPEMAAEAYEDVLRSRPYMVGIRYNLGLALKDMGRPEEAAARIAEAIEAGMNDANAWNNLGLLEQGLGHAERAEQAFRAALLANDTHWHAAYNLARTFLAQGRTSEARQLLIEARDRAISANEDPTPIDALLASLPR